MSCTTRRRALVSTLPPTTTNWIPFAFSARARTRDWYVFRAHSDRRRPPAPGGGSRGCRGWLDRGRRCRDHVGVMTRITVSRIRGRYSVWRGPGGWPRSGGRRRWYVEVRQRRCRGISLVRTRRHYRIEENDLPGVFFGEIECLPSHARKSASLAASFANFFRSFSSRSGKKRVGA